LLTTYPTTGIITFRGSIALHGTWRFFICGRVVLLYAMSKETFYFSHDYNARNDPKLQKLLMKQGQEGKGVYWDLIEMLYEQDGYLLLSECESYAFQLRTSYERITELIRNFDLFITNEKSFYSESVLRRLEERKIKSNKARESVNKRWNDTNVIRTNNERNTNKVKESKIKKEDYIEFSVFWNLYNHKVGNKPGAEKKWHKLTSEEQIKIMEVLPTYLSTIKDKQYQAHAETWLNQRRWENEDLNHTIPVIKKRELDPRYDLIPNPEWEEPKRVSNANRQY
jgi:hypothetical protein